MSSFSVRRGLRQLVPVLALGLLPGVARAQVTPSPEPPPRLFQDQLDLQANANVIQGSGARAIGMGGAFLARADDATAASWNPAGLSHLRRPEISFVMVHGELSASQRDLQGSLVVDDQRHGRAPDFVAFTYPIAIGSTAGAAQISYQRVLSFDADRTIEEPNALPDPQTREIRSRGGFDVIALGSGWQLSRRLRLGATLNRWIDGYQQVLEAQDRSVPTRQNAEYTFGGWNAHFGAIWSPFATLNVGAVLKTGFAADVTLSRSRVDFFQTESGIVQTSNAYSRDDLTLDFPGAMGLGTSWRPRSNLTISLDYTRTRWSTGRISNFFTLQRTELDDEGHPQEPPVPAKPKDFFDLLPYPTLDARQPQHDTSQLRTGAEYVVIRNRLKIPIRAGFFTDDQYFGAIGGPPRFKGVTVGAGLIVGSILLDVAYLHETGSYSSLGLSGESIVPLKNDVRFNQLFISMIYRNAKRP